MAARQIRTAISPRLAANTFLKGHVCDSDLDTNRSMTGAGGLMSVGFVSLVNMILNVVVYDLVIVLFVL